ncbi:hypothetical protein HYC85_030637 [Camellia sinensis]|uniref:Peptidyl-prolyl cis-trans isomerase n=1 Tax=Camellia sinensis TaxID=4442 RepID=A0A7J7G5B3_CAMSI|nr:hypothetical protein HYC85_030637 [Camellia sinensis]
MKDSLSFEDREIHQVLRGRHSFRGFGVSFLARTVKSNQKSVLILIFVTFLAQPLAYFIPSSSAHSLFIKVFILWFYIEGKRVMGKDSKAKESGGKGKGKGKQSVGGSDDTASKGKGKDAKTDRLGTCTYVKDSRHILCEKQERNNEAYKNLEDLGAEYSECQSGKKGGDLCWFQCGKMAGPFQDVAFSTHVGATSAPFKSTRGYRIILSEWRKN